MLKIVKYLLIIIVIAGIGAGGYYGYKKYTGTDDNENKPQFKIVDRDKITLGTAYEYFDSYPTAAQPTSDTITFTSGLYEPLAQFNNERKILPGSGLASNWTNPDNKTWRFTIDPKATFSDGTTITTEDIKFTYDLMVSKQYPISQLFPVLKEVKVVDPHTIDFITTAPDPILVNKLIYLFIISKKAYEANPTATPIGSGPYILKKHTPNVSTIITANPNYWHKEKPRIKEVVYKIFPATATSTDYIKAMNKGEVDLISSVLNPESKKLIANSPNIRTLTRSDDNTVVFAAINTLKSSPFKDVRVRRALAMSIDKKAIIEAACPAGGKTSSQFITNTIFGFNPDIKEIPYDPVGAKKLLTEAGYPNGFSIELYAYTDNETAKTLVKQAKKIDINFNLIEVDVSQFFQTVMQGEYNVTSFGYGVDTGDASQILEGLYHSRSAILGQNNAGYSNKTVDTLIEKAAQTMEMKDRLGYLQQAIKIITEDVAYIPLFTANYFYVMKKDIYWVPPADGFVRPWQMAGKETS